MTLDSFGATADYAWANIMVAVFIMVSPQDPPHMVNAEQRLCTRSSTSPSSSPSSSARSCTRKITSGAARTRR